MLCAQNSENVGFADLREHRLGNQSWWFCILKCHKIYEHYVKCCEMPKSWENMCWEKCDTWWKTLMMIW